MSLYIMGLATIDLHSHNETQQGRSSCPRLQLLAFSLDSIMSLPR